jgi:hypothetical protein
MPVIKQICSINFIILKILYSLKCQLELSQPAPKQNLYIAQLPF